MPRQQQPAQLDVLHHRQQAPARPPSAWARWATTRGSMDTRRAGAAVAEGEGEVVEDVEVVPEGEGGLGVGGGCRRAVLSEGDIGPHGTLQGGRGWRVGEERDESVRTL